MKRIFRLPPIVLIVLIKLERHSIMIVVIMGWITDWVLIGLLFIFIFGLSKKAD